MPIQNDRDTIITIVIGWQRDCVRGSDTCANILRLSLPPSGDDHITTTLPANVKLRHHVITKDGVFVIG